MLLMVSSSEKALEYLPPSMKTHIAAELARLAAKGYTLPTHEDGKIGAINNVYGGGNAAKVDGNTHVNIGTAIGESVVFETPRTKETADPEDDEKTITENTTVADRTHTVTGADIRDNVYGGGNAAEVTGNTYVVVGKKATE